MRKIPLSTSGPTCMYTHDHPRSYMSVHTCLHTPLSVLRKLKILCWITFIAIFEYVWPMGQGLDMPDGGLDKCLAVPISRGAACQAQRLAPSLHQVVCLPVCLSQKDQCLLGAYQSLWTTYISLSHSAISARTLPCCNVTTRFQG